MLPRGLEFCIQSPRLQNAFSVFVSEGLIVRALSSSDGKGVTAGLAEPGWIPMWRSGKNQI